MSPIVNSFADIFYSPLIYEESHKRWKKNHLEYEKLVSIAQEKRINISEQIHKIEQIIEDQPEGKAAILPQSKMFKMLYEIKMYKKYNLEIYRAIAKHCLFHEKHKPVFNMFKLNPKTPQQKLKRLRLDYKKWIEIAHKNKVDVSEPVNKMEHILADLPASHDVHQFKPIRVLYEMKMYEKYNVEIGRKIGQLGLFGVGEEIQAHLDWELRNAVISFQQWADKAAKKNIDISKYTNRMQQVIDNQPDSGAHNQFACIAMLNHIKLSKIYCIQIIRKIAKTEIRDLAQIARKLPGLQHHIALINHCEQFLIKQLPSVNQSGKEPHISQAEEKYGIVMEKMQDMKEKVMKKIRKE